MRQRRLMNQINVVPYIDVMLVLLVIFMVTAPMIQTGSVDLPSAGAVSSPPAEAIVIELDAEGAMSLRKASTGAVQPVDDLGFDRALKEALAANPDQPFLVAANRALEYQKVIDVLEAARLAGVRKISLQTRSTGR